MGPAYHPGEADDGRQFDGGINGVDIAEAVLNHLRFALEDEDDGAAGAADRERLVTLIEYQYGMVNHHQLALKPNCPYFTAKIPVVQGERERTACLIL
jgi:hypothetical protein